MQDPIQTLFCINATYAQHAAVCIVSLLDNNRNLNFNIVVATTQPLGVSESALRASIAPYPNVHLSVKQFDPARELVVRGAHRSIDAYTRLWVEDFFPETVSRVLYLDSDMVVVGSIADLWRMDLGDQLLAATTIPGAAAACRPLSVPEEYGYFQSGVLLINLAKWRESGAFERIRNWLAANGTTAADDQDALNACFYYQRVVLPHIWNVIVPFYYDHHPLGITEVERQEIRRDARIVHFNVPSKPWFYMSRHPRREEYWRYLKLTEWRDYQPRDKSLFNWSKKTFVPYLPKRVQTYLRANLGGWSG